MKKKISVLICCIIIIVSGCGDVKKEEKTSLQLAKQQGEMIVRYIDNKDKNGLKEMFCKKLKKNSNLENDISEMLEFIQGEIVSYDEPMGGRSSWKSDEKGLTEEIIEGEIENIETDAGKQYQIIFGYYNVNKGDKEKLGIFEISIFDISVYNKNNGYPEYGRFDIAIDD